MKSPVPAMIKALRKNIPGTIVDCTWARVTGRTYDPVAGAYVDTITNVSFTGIRGGYRAVDRVCGILAGDFRLTVDSESVPSMPTKGQTITVGDEVCEVVLSEDFGRLAYELQMRRK